MLVIGLVLGRYSDIVSRLIEEGEQALLQLVCAVVSSVETLLIVS